MLRSIVYILQNIISIYAAIMLVYCLAGWFVRDPNNRFMRALGIVAEPPLIPIRRLLWRMEYFRNSPVDFSPLFLFLLLRLVVGFLGRLPGWLS